MFSLADSGVLVAVPLVGRWDDRRRLTPHRPERHESLKAIAESFAVGRGTALESRFPCKLAREAGATTAEMAASRCWGTCGDPS